MTSTSRVEKEIWTKGRKDCAACIKVIEYEDGSVVASAEEDKLTPKMMAKALAREYPKHTFYATFQGGYIYVRADPCHLIVLSGGGLAK